MVTLSLNPKRGNHARYFPHSGYLGLTPVVVSGTVHTRLEEDRRPVEAARLVVRLRCYEAAGVGIRPDAQTCPGPKSAVAVLWQTERTLWLAPNPAEPYVPLGDLDFAFRLVVPVQAVEQAKGGHAVGSITYKTWRTWWQVETVIYHRPSGMMGSKLLKSHALFLADYSRPTLACSSLGPPLTDSDPHLDPDHRNRTGGDSSKRSVLQSSCGRLFFTLSAPPGVCCGDVVRVGYSLADLGHGPDEGGLSLKRVSVALVRTLSVAEPPEAEPRRWKLRRPVGGRPMTTLATTLVEADARLRVASLTPGGRCEGAVQLVVPQPKSRAHYSVGETCRTRLAAVSYTLVLKVTVKSKLGGVEKMELGGLEVRLASVSASELREALAHIDRLRLLQPKVGVETRRLEGPGCGVGVVEDEEEYSSAKRADDGGWNRGRGRLVVGQATNDQVEGHGGAGGGLGSRSDKQQQADQMAGDLVSRNKNGRIDLYHHHQQHQSLDQHQPQPPLNLHYHHHQHQHYARPVRMVEDI